MWRLEGHLPLPVYLHGVLRFLLEGKAVRREADHLLPSSAAFKNECSHICLHGLDSENFILFPLSFQYLLEANVNKKQSILTILRLFRR